MSFLVIEDRATVILLTLLNPSANMHRAKMDKKCNIWASKKLASNRSS